MSHAFFIFILFHTVNLCFNWIYLSSATSHLVSYVQQAILHRDSDTSDSHLDDATHSKSVRHQQKDGDTYFVQM